MIRFIHTSDWHIGLELYEHNRLEEQALFLTWLLEKCYEEKIDALLISGDIYDVSNPSVNAQTLFANFVANFKNKLPHASLVVIGGNHDSGHRMEISRPLTAALGGIHIVGSLNHEDPTLLSKHVIALHDKSGTQLAWCLAIPFLRPSDINCKLKESETVDQAFSRSMSELYSMLGNHAKSLNKDLPIIAMGHLTTIGSERSKSERILIGGVDSVPVTAISEGMDYVALGHIHKAQSVGINREGVTNRTKVQYCGSPLTMDFDERSYNHIINLVELEMVGMEPKITPIKIPQLVEFIRFSDPPKTWDEVEAEIENFDWSKWKDTPTSLHPFVDIHFLAQGALGDLRSKTESLIKKYPFRLVGSPKRIMKQQLEEDSSKTKDEILNMDLKASDSPLNIFEKFYSKKNKEELPVDLKESFNEIFNETKIKGITK